MHYPSFKGGFYGGKAKAIIEELLSCVGITINRTQLYDIQVKDERFYERVLRDTILGLGKSYVDEW